MKKLAILAVLLAVAVPAMAAVSTVNNGDGTSTIRIQYTFSNALALDVRDDVCRGIGWTSTVLCGQTMVIAGQCSAGQINTQVANPQTCPQAIDAWVTTQLRSMRKAGEDKETLAPVAAALEANNDGDIQP